MKKKPKRRCKYGYVEFVDKRKLQYDGHDDNIEPEIRKPTPSEREEIILNDIRANSGKSVEVWWLARKITREVLHEQKDSTENPVIWE